MLKFVQKMFIVSPQIDITVVCVVCPLLTSSEYNKNSYLSPTKSFIIGINYKII